MPCCDCGSTMLRFARRPGHDEADLLRRRHIVASLRFGAGTRTVEIDTGRPLVEVIADARKAIDSILHHHWDHR